VVNKKQTKKYFLKCEFLVVNQVPFEIEESGWGEFETQIAIFFVDPNEKPVFIYIYICFCTKRFLIELF
jgi:transcription initiation factor IIF auxiliary subunit